MKKFFTIVKRIIAAKYTERLKPYPYILPRFEWRFSSRALLATGALLAIEIAIARFFHDPLIRFFLGDVLVMLLMYAFLRIFLQGSEQRLCLALLVFACLVETGQYFHLATILGLAPNSLGEIILGATFDWKDLLAYIIGTGLNLWISPVFQTPTSLKISPTEPDS